MPVDIEVGRVRQLPLGLLSSERRVPRHRSEGMVSVFRALFCKETHVQTIRFAPPLVVGRDDLARALDTIAAVIGG